MGEDDEEDGDGQGDVNDQKDGMERRQWGHFYVPLAQQEWLSLCHSCETARDQHLAVEKQKIHSSQGLQLIDPLLMIDVLSKWMAIFYWN